MFLNILEMFSAPGVQLSRNDHRAADVIRGKNRCLDVHLNERGVLYDRCFPSSANATTHFISFQLEISDNNVSKRVSSGHKSNKTFAFYVMAEFR